MLLVTFTLVICHSRMHNLKQPVLYGFGVLRRLLRSRRLSIVPPMSLIFGRGDMSYQSSVTYR